MERRVSAIDVTIETQRQARGLRPSAGIAVSDSGPGNVAKEETASSLRFLTREELAEALQVSLRTVDSMVREENLPHMRLKGNLVRFYLPDVVRHLTATALTAKRRWPGAKAIVERRVPRAEFQKGARR